MSNFIKEQAHKEIAAAKRLGKGYLSFMGWYLIVVLAILSISSLTTGSLIGAVGFGGLAYWIWYRNYKK